MNMVGSQRVQPKKTPKKNGKRKKTKTPATRKIAKIANMGLGKSKKNSRAALQDPEVINIDDSDDEILTRRKRPAHASISVTPRKIISDIDIFEDSCSENEFN